MVVHINVSLNVNLGKRLVRVGDKVLGACDGVTINVTEATPEEVMELQKAQKIILVRPNREELKQ